MGEPYPDPVQFDQQLATQAASTLRAAASQLQSLMSDDVPRGNKALQSWKGKYADRFRTDFGTMQTSSQQLITDLLAWAKSIDGAATSAAQLQRQHEAANQKWLQEHPRPTGPVRAN